MKFAMDLDGNRILPSKHGRGQCPFCNSQVIARCGNKRAHHWAHESLRDCEYSEYTHIHETPWHINWKNNFPIDWHEIILQASNGEKHISDVRTPSGLTIEFQHPPISEEERISREKFYISVGKMIWVVDGTKSINDWVRLSQNPLLLEPVVGVPNYVFQCQNAKLFLPTDWLKSDVPVFWDFPNSEHPSLPSHSLICVYANLSKTKHLFIPIKKDLFIELCQTQKIYAWFSQHIPHNPVQKVQPKAPPLTTTNRINISSVRKNYTPYPIYYEIYRELGIIKPRRKSKNKNTRSSNSKRHIRRGNSN